MRIHEFHKSATAPSQGAPMQPAGNSVGVQVSAFGNGAVSATVQMRGRIDALAALEAIGAPIVLSGTAAPGVPVSASVSIDTTAAYLYADLTAVSAISFRAVASEADR